LTVARLLTPEEVGLAAIALTFSSLAFLLADLGLGAAIVQRATLTEADRSTAFWTNAGLGVLLTLAGVGLSGPIASLFHQPRVQPLLAVLSLTFILTALGTTQGSLLIRALHFRSLELRTIAATAAGVAAAIVIAALGYGPWAIIAQALVVSGVSTALLWRSSSWRPRLLYSTDSLRHLLGFGGAIFGAGVVRYFERNLDNLLIGRFLGAAALGVYGVAYNVMLVPVLRLATPLQQVFFPALTQLQASTELAPIWLRMSRVLAAVTVPAMLGMAVVAPDFIVVLLGEKWRSAIPVLQVLTWVGILNVASLQASLLLEALGRAGAVLRYTIASSIVSAVGFAVGLHWGIVGVAAGYAIAKTFLVPTYLGWSTRPVGLSLTEFWKAVAGPVQAAAGMAICVLGARLLLLDNLSAGPRLAVLILLGLVVYLALCRWRSPELVQDIRQARAQRSAVQRVPAQSA
jgi:O-antigen/teichoic acid export membrane protein